MKKKCILFGFVFIVFLGMQVSHAQTSDPSMDNLLPAFAEKYNKSPLGENVFVFNPGMDMKEVQSLLDTIFKIQGDRIGFHS